VTRVSHREEPREFEVMMSVMKMKELKELKEVKQVKEVKEDGKLLHPRMNACRCAWRASECV
jgi:hypothetical protein